MDDLVQVAQLATALLLVLEATVRLAGAVSEKFAPRESRKAGSFFNDAEEMPSTADSYGGDAGAAPAVPCKPRAQEVPSEQHGPNKGL
jgi:hypothetical protein